VEEPFTFDADDDGSTASATGAHQRAEPRDSMFLSATIRHRESEGGWTLRVRNISAGGLMADCAEHFARGDKIEMELRGVGLQGGTIVWTAGDRIGVAFDKPINPMLTRKPVGAGRTPVASVRR
jgi:hypothetical protein